MTSIAVLPPLLLAQFNSKTAQLFPGLLERCREFSNQAVNFPDEVKDDMNGRQGALATQLDSDIVDDEGEEFLVKDTLQVSNSVMDHSETSNSQDLTDMDSTGLRSILKEASKGVSEGTNADYKRYSSSCFIGASHLYSTFGL